MSKPTQSHPIILKKSDAQRPPKKKPEPPQQPKILTKSATATAAAQQPPPPQSQHPTQQKRDTDVQQEVPQMKASHRFMFPHFNIDPKLFDFLDHENTDFLVVAAIGAKNVGKSTLLNIVADQEYVKVEDGGRFEAFSRQHEVFGTSSERSYEGSTVDAFITTDRIIVLDPSPLANNVQRRDMIVAESDDLKLLLVLLQICHLVVVVHAGFPDLSLLRLLRLADSMIPTDVQHRPRLLYVANRVQPGVRAPRPVDGARQLTVPDLRHAALNLHHDAQQVVQDYQEQVFMLKRFSLLNDDCDEVFNERRWSQRVMQVMEALKGDYFLRKYDALREKYHQAVES